MSSVAAEGDDGTPRAECAGAQDQATPETPPEPQMQPRVSKPEDPALRRPGPLATARGMSTLDEGRFLVEEWFRHHAKGSDEDRARRNSVAGAAPSTRRHARTLSSSRPFHAILKNLRGGGKTMARLRMSSSSSTSSESESQAFSSWQSTNASSCSSDFFEVDLDSVYSSPPHHRSTNSSGSYGSRRASANCVLTMAQQQLATTPARSEEEDEDAQLAEEAGEDEVDRVEAAPRATKAVRLQRNQTENPQQRPSSFARELWGVRSLFYSKRQRKSLDNCDMEHLVYILQWYPQYLREILTSECPKVRSTHKTLCNTVIFKLFSRPERNMAHRWALDAILWHVLCDEFTVNSELPLRGNNAATFLLSAYAQKPSCQQAITNAIRPVLTRACQEHPASEPLPKRTQASIALGYAKEILDALCRATFPPGLHRICNQISLLVRDKGHRQAVVGGSFFFLRYVNPAVLAFDSSHPRNKILIEIARTMQAVCNHVAQAKRREQHQNPAGGQLPQSPPRSSPQSPPQSSPESPPQSPLENQPADASHVECASQMGRLLDHLCAEDRDQAVSELDEMNRQVQKHELLLDIERCLSKPLFSDAGGDLPFAGEPVLVSALDARNLAKAVLLHVDSHGNRLERQALRAFVDRVAPYLEGFVEDEVSAAENPYVRLQPRWFYAPPLCLAHAKPTQLRHRPSPRSPRPEGGFELAQQQPLLAKHVILQRLALASKTIAATEER